MKLKALKKGIAALVLSVVTIGCFTPAVKGEYVYTKVEGSKQANKQNTSWRSHTFVEAYETSGHTFNLKVEAWMAKGTSATYTKHGYACRETTSGSGTINSSYVSNNNLYAIHSYYIGTTLINKWQEN